MSHVFFKHAGRGAPLLVLPTNTLDVCFDASKHYFKCVRWLLKVLAFRHVNSDKSATKANHVLKLVLQRRFV